MDATKIDLNKPAFGEGAQKLDDVKEVKVELAPAPEPVTEPAVVEPAAEPEPSVEEQKVPYSRLKRYVDEAKALRQEAAEWRARAESVQQTPQTHVDLGEMDPLWIKLYGDSPESREAWKIQQAREEAVIARAEEKALEAMRNRQNEEARRNEENVKKLDDGIEELQLTIGRDLTEKEQTAVLDIVDEYTPKDTDGNYLGETISFDKAWEIYELKAQASKAPKAQARDAVAALSGTPSNGEPSVTAEQNKNFNPFDWDSWKRRI